VIGGVGGDIVRFVDDELMELLLAFIIILLLFIVLLLFILLIA
jgi:hypothetical protein